MIEKIVVASHNQGKIKEIEAMLAPLNIKVFSATDLDLPDVEETETTFEGNACLKADALAKISGIPCLADDSGLCVKALDGRPGVYSARYAPVRAKSCIFFSIYSRLLSFILRFFSCCSSCYSVQKKSCLKNKILQNIQKKYTTLNSRNFDKAMEMLVGELNDAKTDDWSAHFMCVLALAIPGKETIIFEGRVDGKIVPERSGSNGFGFDPIFVPNGFDKTFANFTKEEKATISHRGRAFEKFVSFLLT